MGLKKFLRTNPITRKFYAYLIDAKQRHIAKKGVQKQGVLIIKKMQKRLEQGDYPFFFDMGTLLGIVREGRLLKHDMDIDLGVIVQSEADKEKIKELLTSFDAQLKYEYVVQELGVIEQSYLYQGVKFDISYYYREADQDVCYLMYRDPEKTYSDLQMDVVQLTCPAITATTKVAFQGLKVNAPANPEAYLAVRYGENWRIPDKKYVYWKGPSTRFTSYTGEQVTY